MWIVRLALRRTYTFFVAALASRSMRPLITGVAAHERNVKYRPQGVFLANQVSSHSPSLKIRRGSSRFSGCLIDPSPPVSANTASALLRHTSCISPNRVSMVSNEWPLKDISHVRHNQRTQEEVHLCFAKCSRTAAW
jgi:hypothetical protein